MSSAPSVLLIGASRGLGHAMAAEFIKHGWSILGTVRGHGRTLLHDLAEQNPGHVEIETLDLIIPAELAALHDRLARRRFEMLFVNAGATNPDPNCIGIVSRAAALVSF